METLVSELKHGLIYDGQSSMYPSLLVGHCHGQTDLEFETDTAFGVVTEGKVEILREGLSPMPLSAGMYFSVPGRAKLRGEGKAALFVRKGFRGLFEIGGPAESFGRLCYIDNCRATVLVSPPRLGDPCLNLLTFPPQIQQTPHIHPTVRLGAVLSGQGRCILPGDRFIELKPGMVFCLNEGQVHCFHSESALVVVAYHPDSDIGYTDQEHPMLSRTYISR